MNIEVLSGIAKQLLTTKHLDDELDAIIRLMQEEYSIEQNITFKIKEFKTKMGKPDYETRAKISTDNPFEIQLNEYFIDRREEILFYFLHEFRHSMQRTPEYIEEVKNNCLFLNLSEIFGYQPLYSVSPTERDANNFALSIYQEIIEYLKVNDKDFNCDKLQKCFDENLAIVNESIIQSADQLYQNGYIPKKLSEDYSILNDINIQAQESYSAFGEMLHFYINRKHVHEVMPEIKDVAYSGDINDAYCMSLGDRKHRVYVNHGENGMLVSYVNFKDLLSTSIMITPNSCFIQSMDAVRYDKEYGGIESVTDETTKYGKLSVGNINKELHIIKQTLPKILTVDGKYNPAYMTVYMDPHNFDIHRSKMEKVASANGFKILESHMTNEKFMVEPKNITKMQDAYDKRLPIQEDDIFVEHGIIDEDWKRLIACKMGAGSDNAILSEDELDKLYQVNLGSMELQNTMSEDRTLDDSQLDKTPHKTCDAVMR